MKGKRFLSYVLASAMGLSLFAGMAFTASAETLDSTDDTNTSGLVTESDNSADETLQELYDNFNTGFDEDGNVDSSVYDYKDGSEDENLTTLSDSFPVSYDLRHVGGELSYDSDKQQSVLTGGTSYVTPVKFQNPWGTCWAFGICAACESSILYEKDEGTDGSVTTGNTNLDLSEHHLSWFAKNHIPAEGEEGYGTNYVNNQDGEGMYYLSTDTNASMEGGTPYYGTSVFAAGEGVVTEDFAPYNGLNKEVMVKRNDDADKSLEKYLYYPSKEMWEAEQDKSRTTNYHLFCYSKKDDWSLDESDRFYQSYKLEESSVLPAANGTVDKTTGTIVANEDGINAIKSELTQGRAVEVAFCADSSDPNAEGTSKSSRYINENWAHYCWDSRQANHSVCIVGWDDDYDASNFGQESAAVWDKKGNVQYKLKGSDQYLTYKDANTVYYIDEAGERQEYPLTSDKIEIVRETDSSVTVPSGNGAWIVKNSWGSSSSEFANKNTWGDDGTGYFYLSYYDTSISMLETYDFATTEEEKSEYNYSIIDQYDYMTAEAASSSVAYSPVIMTNVFTAQEDMVINAVSAQTTVPGTEVTYCVYVLNDGENYPSDLDDFAATENETYTYGGYHRCELSTPVVVSKGEKYAVVVQESYTEKDIKNYSICSNTGDSELAGLLYGTYSVGVINPGESYVGVASSATSVKWTDYSDYITVAKAQQKNGDYYTYDNFSIKAYGTPTEKGAPVLKSAVNTKAGVTISWESKGKSAKYRLFYRESGTKKWTALVDTTETSYVTTALEAGTSYDFTVCCVGSDGMNYTTSYDKTGVSCTYLPYVNLKAAADTTGISLSWAKVSGAKGYNIYRKSETSDYELIGKVCNGSTVAYKDASAKKGEVYTYKVKAYANSSESASKAVSKVILKTPTVKLSSTKSKTVTVKWSKNTKATGYQIKYRVGSKIKCITIKNASTVKKVLKKLKKGKICKVKVRSYKKVSGKTYYSNWSKVKKVKIK